MAFERWLLRARLRLRSLFQRDRVEAEMDAELQDHLAQAIAHHMARGLSHDEARRAALLNFGGIEASKEAMRDARRVRPIEEISQDLRFGVRSWRRAPGFTTVALLALALGIGANTAVFTVVNGVLLRPMPFADPGRLLAVSFAPVHGPFRVGPAMIDAHFVPFRESQTAFSGLAASGFPVGATLTGIGDPVRIQALGVTPNFFDVLGVRPVLGRTFAAHDADPGRGRIVMISPGFWRGRLGADPGVLGRSLRLNGNDYRIVGVAPVGFDFPEGTDVWTPFEVRLQSSQIQFLRVIGRLGPGASVSQAQAEIAALARRQRAVSGDPSDPDWVARVLPVQDLEVADSRYLLLLFAGAVAFVLLIACANVANLFLVRAAGRTREMAVRASLGAGRARLIRQLLTESTLLAVAGGVLGLVVAVLGVQALMTLAPAGVLPRAGMIRLDRFVLLFTLGISIVTGLVFGILPALQASRFAMRHALQQAGRSVTAGGERLRAALVVAEIALALVLLAGAGLLLRSVTRLQAVDPGFQTEHRVAMDVSLPARSYRTADQMHVFQSEVLARLSSLDGVQSVAAVDDRPLSPFLMMGDFQLRDGRPLPPHWTVNKVCVSENYFRTMGISIVSGREFTPQDDAHGEGVVVISESVAKTLWPGGDALGQRISMEEKPTAGDWLTVVGIAADVHQQRLDKGADAATYQPLAQVKPAPFFNHLTFVVRSTVDAASIGPAVRGALHEVDANLPIDTLASLPDLVSATTKLPRFQTWLVGVFAALALALATIGVSGVLACSVSLRTREFGIRRALGAQTSQVIGLVLRRTLALAVAGIGIGLAAAWVVTRVLASMLFEVKPHDPAAFAGAGVVLLLAALGAAAIPAWRARSVDPVVAFRTE